MYTALLGTIGGARYLRENVFSPYYNHIDFEIWQDEAGGFAPLGELSAKFVALKRSSDSPSTNSDGVKWTKYAIVINLDGDYTQVSTDF